MAKKEKNTREYFLNRMLSQTDKRGVEFFAHYLSDRPSVRVTCTSGGVQTVMVSVYWLLTSKLNFKSPLNISKIMTKLRICTTKRWWHFRLHESSKKQWRKMRKVKKSRFQVNCLCEMEYGWENKQHRLKVLFDMFHLIVNTLEFLPVHWLDSKVHLNGHTSQHFFHRLKSWNNYK